jgi:hypothetical protein
MALVNIAVNEILTYLSLTMFVSCLTFVCGISHV